MERKESFSVNQTNREKDERIAKLTRAIELLQYEKLKCNFLRNFTNFVSRNFTYDEILRESVFFFRQEFKSSYAAIFLYTEDSFCFEYLTGTGYKQQLMPPIDESGSIMGEAIHTSSTVIVPNISERYFHIPLNQSPAEQNVICVPIITPKRKLILRIANIPDNHILTELGSVLSDVAATLGKTIDHIYQTGIISQTLRGMKFSLAISRLPEKTLEKREIIRRAFENISALSETSVHLIIVKDNETTSVIEKSDPNFYLGGSPAAHNVYIKNLFESFPDGSGFIENIHKTPRWSWPNIHIMSLCISPISIEKRLLGILVSVSKDESFSESTQTLFGLATQQLSMTLEKANYFRQQEEFASKDGLTGLYNRRMFDALLSSEASVAGRYQRSLSMIIMDIDHFKNFNDTYGHKTGDEVIQLVANTIASTIRTSDRAFRYGGEEFVIMCPETGASSCALLAERLRQRVEQAYTKDRLRVTISLGVSEYLTGESTEQFTRRVDALLYKSKESGRNRVTLG